MKNFKIIPLIILGCFINGFTQNKTIQIISGVDGALLEFTSSNLPIVVINTDGQEIPNDEKITADMGIIFNGEGVRNYLTDQLNNYNGKIGIEVRGSSSQSFPKKQYAVETRDSLGEDLEVSLLGFPEESDWILFAPYNDKSLMRDVLSYKLASELGRYASRTKYCEVVLNNEYIGIYVLLEKVKRDNDRVDIKKLEPTDIEGDALTGGYIIKIDKWDGENNSGWNSTYLPYPQSPYPVYYQYHYPKPDEIVQQQKDYIRGKIFQYETVMSFSNNISDSLTGYPKYLDVNSFVDFVIANEVAKNVDGYRLSTYLYKDRDSRNPKIFAGPVWDFNLGFGNADYYQGWMTDGWQLEYLSDYSNMPWDSYLIANWWIKLFDDESFSNKVYARWHYLKGTVYNTQHIFNYIDSLTVLLDESQVRNFQKWPVLGVYVWPNYYVGQTYWQEILYLKSWIQNRLNWMDANMIGEPTIVLENDQEPVKNFQLFQNYPNPFNPSTTIEFTVPEEGFVEFVVYDVLGREIKKMVSDYFNRGHYKINFDAGELVSGVYIYRIKFNDMIYSKSMVLIK